jgi:hypothetical protein
VLTRSTLAAFFLTLVAWLLICGLNKADNFLFQIDDIYHERAREAVRDVKRLDQNIADLEARMKTAPPPGNPAGPTAPNEKSAEARQLEWFRIARERALSASMETNPPSQFRVAQQVTFICNTLVPKTKDTIGLLDRVLFTDKDIQGTLTAEQDEPRRRRRGPQLPDILHWRNLWWVLGSSLAFEAAILAWAGWRFSRRDY